MSITKGEQTLELRDEPIHNNSFKPNRFAARFRLGTNAMEPIVTHGLSFLIGTAIGAAGAYFADKYTDIRRRKEARKELRASFSRLESLMPRLFAEMRKDLVGDKSGLIRDIVVLPAPWAKFNGDKIRFAYYESHYTNLREQFHHLLGAKLISDITPGTTPIYRMTEPFMELLVAR